MLRLKTILQSSYILFLIFISSFIISFIRCNISTNSKYSLEDTKIEGYIIDKKIDGNKLSFIIKEKEKVKCTFYIKEEKDVEYYNNLELGKYLILEGTMQVPSNNTIPNTFNYKKYLYYKHINYTFSVSNINVANKKINILYKIKNCIIKRIKNYKSHTYLNTFILGNKNDLDPDIYSKYQEAGIAHIFAISGMHVSLMVSIILKMLKKVKDDIKYPFIIIFLLLYIFITGYASSIIRSVTLFTCIYINKRFDFNLETIQCFYIAISIILFIEPYMIKDIGFIYSTVSSYSLIRYNYLLKGNYFVSILKVSILAFLVTLPITINLNYEINILSIFNNIFIVPIISIFIYPLSLLTFFIKPLDNIFFYIMNLFEKLSKYFFVCNIVIPKMNIIVILIYYVILIIFFNTYNKRILILLIGLLVIVKYSLIFDNRIYTCCLDVGQGDATLIKYKNNSILIDTGGKSSYEEEEWKKKREYLYSDNNIKFFKSIGITKLDYLILSHGDYDHMGEAVNLVENFKVEKVIFNCGPYNDLEKELIKVLDQKKIPYYSCIKELNIDKYKLEFLNTKEYDNENDNSNVIYFNYNNYKFLFMGDAGVKKEKDILEKYNLKDIDFLKVGHHGSNTSSSELFINSINPKYGLISVGKNNRYGHPKDEVLETLKNSKIYRTDLDGSIEIKLNKNGYKIRTCPP